jgi:hypothetical protein
MQNLNLQVAFLPCATSCSHPPESVAVLSTILKQEIPASSKCGPQQQGRVEANRFPFNYFFRTCPLP